MLLFRILSKLSYVIVNIYFALDFNNCKSMNHIICFYGFPV